MPKQVTNASRRERGLRRLEVWLPSATIAALDAICERTGYTRREVIEGYVAEESEQWGRLDRKRKNPTGANRWGGG